MNQMDQMNQIQNDEIDLFELFQTLWDGKWKIITTTFIAAVIGVVFGGMQPKSVKVSTTIQEGKSSVFLPYTPLNYLIKEKEFFKNDGPLGIDEQFADSINIDSASIFEMFVVEFKDYEEMTDILSRNDFVKQSVKDLDEDGKQRALIGFAKAFDVMPSSKDGKNWLLTFEWRNRSEGIALVNDAVQKTLINVQKTLKNNIHEMAKAVKLKHSYELETLRNEFEAIKRNQKILTKKRLQFLAEQSAIAKELGIATTGFDTKALSQNGVSLSVNSADVPYYLRGYKAIDKEIALIESRAEEVSLFMASDYLGIDETKKRGNLKARGGYLEMMNKITSLENDLSSSQLKTAAKLLERDNPGNWIEFDLALANTQSYNKSMLYFALSTGLGGIIGVIYVLISNAIRKRKKEWVRA